MMAIKSLEVQKQITLIALSFYHGVTLEQLAEIVLVVGIEAGFPAAMGAFKRVNIALERYNEIKQ